MRRDGQGVLLLLTGAALLRLGFGGAAARYGVNSVLVLVAGFALLAVAGAALWQHLQEATSGGAGAPAGRPVGRPAGRHEAAQEEHELDEGPDRLASAWLLLVPVLVVLLIAP